jgi:putative polyketide hydroxylase
MMRKLNHIGHDSRVAPVLIAGAGPIGLGAALELARCGVQSILFERNGHTSWHPKTRNYNTRTMEIARGWGREIYDELRSLDLPPSWKSPIRFLESIVGKQTGQVDAQGFLGAGPKLSPVGTILSSQDMLEPVMLRAVLKTGMVDVRFNHEVVEIVRGSEPTATEVEIKVKDRSTGDIGSVTGLALIAADGASSFVRASLGTEMDGPKKLAHYINCYYRADIERYAGARPGILHFVSNDRAQGVFQPLDARGRWLSQIVVPEDQWSTDIFTKQRCTEWIRAGVGVPDLKVEVLSITKWQMNAVVGRKLIEGRVVLMGDAAHMFPPTGGLGVNTGMQGMHNGIWKLALFLRGKAGFELWRTYETERRPVARWAADQSYHNSRQVVQLARLSRGLAADNDLSPEEVIAATRRYGNHLGLELGSIYSSPAIVDDGTEAPKVRDDYSDYVPTGRPGHRAPHVWIELDGEKLSTLDLVHPEFSIFAGRNGSGWRRIAADVSREFGLETPCFVIGGPEIRDVEETFLIRFGLSEDGAVLVRPDGWVAFRSHSIAGDSADKLRSAFAQILQRTENSAL